MPDVVIALEAPDDFLRNRVMNLVEAVVADTHNTEEGLKKRLAEYKNANAEDETVLNYFDELEFHPEKIGKFEHDTLKCKNINVKSVMIKTLYIE